MCSQDVKENTGSKALTYLTIDVLLTVSGVCIELSTDLIR